MGGVIIPEKTKKGYAIAEEGDGIYINRPHQKRGVVQKGMIQTIKTSVDDIGVIVSSNNENKRFYKQALETFYENKVEEGDTINAFNKTVDKSGLSPTITTRPEGFKTAILACVKDIEIIKYGTYYTWKDLQGNINTQCNRAFDENGVALTIACANTGKVLINEKCKKCGNCKNFYYDTFCGFNHPMCRIFGSLLNKEDVAITCKDYDYKETTKYDSCLRIRKLTPRECWRLMGFDDEDFEKAEKVNSNAQLYKQAGNSIIVNVLMAIFKELL